jgi:hypothetical protein
VFYHVDTTPRFQLTLEPTISPPKKRARTHQRVLIFESKGGHEKMETKKTTQHDDDSM